MIPRKRHRRKKGKVLGVAESRPRSMKAAESGTGLLWCCSQWVFQAHPCIQARAHTPAHSSECKDRKAKHTKQLLLHNSGTPNGCRKEGRRNPTGKPGCACLPSKQAKAHRLLRSKRFLTTAQGSRKGKNENESAGENTTTMRWGKSNYSPGAYYLSM